MDFEPVYQNWVEALFERPLLLVLTVITLVIIVSAVLKAIPALKKSALVLMYMASFAIYMSYYENASLFFGSGIGGFFLFLIWMLGGVMLYYLIVGIPYGFYSLWRKLGKEAKERPPQEGISVGKKRRRKEDSAKNMVSSQKTSPSLSEWTKEGIEDRPYLISRDAFVFGRWVALASAFSIFRLHDKVTSSQWWKALIGPVLVTLIAVGVVLASYTLPAVRDFASERLGGTTERLGAAQWILVVDEDETVPLLIAWASCRYGITLNERQASELLSPLSVPFDAFWPLSMVAESRKVEVVVPVEGASTSIRLHHNGGRAYALVAAAPLNEKDDAARCVSTAQG